jgi:hypothetical protein
LYFLAVAAIALLAGTVPLLALELLAICTLAGAALRRNQVAGIVTGFVMVFCGFVSLFVVGDDAVAA